MENNDLALVNVEKSKTMVIIDKNDSPKHGTTRVTTQTCYSIAATTPDLTIEILNSVF